MNNDQHSLNAKIDKTVYQEFQYILKKNVPKLSVNKGTEAVLVAYIEAWKKKNKVESIPI